MPEKETPPFDSTCAPAECLHVEDQHSLPGIPTNDLLRFYSSRRQRAWDDLKAALVFVDASASERQIIKEKVGELMTKPGNEPRGWVAEVVGSYLLSQSTTTPLLAPYLVRATWPDEPFRVAKGIDILFLDKADCSLIIAEAKASNCTSGSKCKAVLHKLRKDLERTRLEEILDANGADGWSELLYRFRNMRDQGLLGDDDYARLADHHHYTRYGIAMGHKPTIWRPISRACPIDVSAEYPLTLWLVEVPDQNKFSEVLMAVEIAMQGNT